MIKKKICLVTSDFMGIIPNGGVGTSVAELAFSLAKSGYEVDVLFANSNTNEDFVFHWWQAYFLLQKINIISLPNLRIKIDQGFQKPKISYAVYVYLRDKQYNTIIFPEMHGTSYYVSLAKKAGLAFLETKIWVMFHGPGLWHVNYNADLPTDVHQLVMDHMERKCLEMADKVFFATNHSKNVAFLHSYVKEEQDHEVILFPFNVQDEYKIPTYEKANSIVFFGRIETRKGIEEFLDALVLIKEEIIEKDIRIHILGNYGHVKGREAEEIVSQWMKKHEIPIYLVVDKNREEALRYLSKLKPLVVLASKEETMGYTLIECLAMKAAFICSNIPAYQDVLGELGISSVDMFNPKRPSEIAKLILKNLDAPKQHSISKEDSEKVKEKWIATIQNDDKEVIVVKNKTVPKFSLCVLSYKRPHFLKQVLTNLESIQLSNLHEILIYDDFSNDNETIIFLKSISEFLKNIPIKVFYGNENKGPSFGRNFLADKASGSHLVFLDDDNLLSPTAFKIWSDAIHANDKDIYVSSLLHFYEEDSIEKSKIWIPVGNDLGVNALYNLIGDANCCFKRTSFLKSGGFDVELRGREDQEFLMRACSRGLSYHIIPEMLIKYRIHEKNESKKHNDSRNLQLFTEKLGNSVYHPDFSNIINLLRVFVFGRFNMEQREDPNFYIINPRRTNIQGFTKHQPSLATTLESLIDVPQEKAENNIFLNIPIAKKGEILSDEEFAINKESESKLPGKKYRLLIHSQCNCFIQFDENQRIKIFAGINIIFVVKNNEKLKPVTNQKNLKLLITEVGEVS